MQWFFWPVFCLILAMMPATEGWAQDDAALLARGSHLMNGVVACANCHMPRDEAGRPQWSKGLSGGMLFDEEPFKAYAANITPDPETGIGLWTDAQLARAIREGIRPDGSLIGPPMPIAFYRNISDDDLAAIVAYLRAQPPVRNVVLQSTYNMPLPPSYGPTVDGVETPAASDTVRYGEYLANIGHCMECHTPRDNRGMLVAQQLGAGGQAFRGPGNRVAVSSNLTPGPHGLQNWADAQIARALRKGVASDGTQLMPIMAFDWYKNIDAPDMAALIAYLRLLPPQPFGGAH